jgi:hypothetical protein
LGIQWNETHGSIWRELCAPADDRLGFQRCFYRCGSAIDFPAATESWGAIMHVVTFDALTTQRAIGDGDVYRQMSLAVSLD